MFPARASSPRLLMSRPAYGNPHTASGSFGRCLPSATARPRIDRAAPRTARRSAVHASADRRRPASPSAPIFPGGEVLPRLDRRDLRCFPAGHTVAGPLVKMIGHAKLAADAHFFVQSIEAHALSRSRTGECKRQKTNQTHRPAAWHHHNAPVRSRQSWNLVGSCLICSSCAMHQRRGHALF
jgi:hypothetical protein